jgi:hypothetical protein
VRIGVELQRDAVVDTESQSFNNTRCRPRRCINDLELAAREPSDPGWSRSDGKVQRTRDSARSYSPATRLIAQLIGTLPLVGFVLNYWWLFALVLAAVAVRKHGPGWWAAQTRGDRLTRRSAARLGARR